MDLWIPNAGMVNTSHLVIGRKLKEYDERLFLFEREDHTYGVYFKVLRRSAGGINDQEFLEVLDLGHEVPHWDTISAALWKKDLKARGVDKILEEIDEANDKLHVKTREAADQATGETAEYMESFAHRQGETNYHRSLPKKDPKHKVK